MPSHNSKSQGGTSSGRLDRREERTIAYRDPLWPSQEIDELLKGGVSDVYRDWNAFSQAAGTATAAVVVLDTLRGPVWREFVRFRSERAVPTLLITRATLGNGRRLKDVLVDDILFDVGMSKRLPIALARLSRRAVLPAAAAMIREAPHLGEELRETLARACELRRPLRTTDALAKLMGYGRDTFAARWQAAGISPAARPHLFIDWLLVAYAARIRSRTGESWRTVASALEVKTETLAAAIHRVHGLSLDRTLELSRTTLLSALQRILTFPGE